MKIRYLILLLLIVVCNQQKADGYKVLNAWSDPIYLIINGSRWDKPEIVTQGTYNTPIKTGNGPSSVYVSSTKTGSPLVWKDPADEVKKVADLRAKDPSLKNKVAVYKITADSLYWYFTFDKFI